MAGKATKVREVRDDYARVPPIVGKYNWVSEDVSKISSVYGTMDDIRLL